jgi:hypothetical protein
VLHVVCEFNETAEPTRQVFIDETSTKINMVPLR